MTLEMMTLVDKVNSDPQLAALSINPTSTRRAEAGTPAPGKPTAFSVGVTAAGVGAGAVTSGAAVERAID